MSNKPGYVRLLSYHLVLILLPMFLAAIVFFQQLYDIAYYLFILYKWVWADEPNTEMSLLAIMIRLMFRLMTTGFIFSIIVGIFQAGLHFIPGLCKQHQLSLRTILSTGVRAFIPIYLIKFVGLILIGGLNSLVLAIPIFQVFALLLYPFCLAVFSIYQDYLYSINWMRQTSLISHLFGHFKHLFVKNKQFIVWACVLALSYYLFYLASIFIRPYIQLKIAERLPLTDGKRPGDEPANVHATA